MLLRLTVQHNSSNGLPKSFLLPSASVSSIMGSTSQAYGSPPGLCGPANTFAAHSSGNMLKNSNFFKSFGNGPNNTRTIEPQQTEEQMSRRPSLGINSNEQSFFNFDPPSSTGSPFHNQSQFGTPGGIPGWGSDMSFRPLSPPDSASPFSKDWNYGFPNMSNPPSSNIFNTIQPNNSARAHYGQVTPPDDEHEDELLLEHQPCEKQQQQQGLNDSSSNKKRKRGNGSNSKDPNQLSTKRSRKNNSRNAASSNQDPCKPEDVRRSKFLERNRVAASKCRQKKKEWTQNLEDRGRTLQKGNSNLRILVDSLRQETLFLKGEMLRHGGCNYPQINDYLKSGTTVLPDGLGEMVMKRESSPFEKEPESVTDLDGHSVVDEEVAQQSQTNAEIAGDENALEALLTSSINHDASEESTANQAGG